MTAIASPRRRWLQFGIGSLLFVMFLASGFLAGFRWGYGEGHQRRIQGGLYTKVYYVNDIVWRPPNDEVYADSLLRYIEATCSPTTWGKRGGHGSASYFSTNQAIVVSHSQDIHNHIADILKQCRRLKSQGMNKELDAILDSVTIQP